MKILKALEWLPLSIPFKIVITGLVGALGGSGYIGFLSEYATYYYAWENAFRIPAEGSPYLKIAISSITFIAILFSASIYILFYALIKSVQYYSHLFKLLEKPTENLGGISRKIVKLLIIMNKPIEKDKAKKLIVYLILFFTIFFFCVFYFGTSNHSDNNQKPPLWFMFIASLLSAFLYALPIIALTYKEMTVPIAISMALVFLVASPFILFNQQVYSKILQEIGYGGGINIEVSQENNKNEFKLLLRTTDSLFVKSRESSAIEIPLSEIKEIKYLK
ncbi:hypothetical protein [Pantoea stewartii]|uniref:hypothetical protein n=1 Tax=Pantoea stewartii TaxID=66269 RepID=UPI001980CAAD|nr:hypothetical protein [Pantoea stewartii]